jgi:hypothetical protein
VKSSTYSRSVDSSSSSSAYTWSEVLDGAATRLSEEMEVALTGGWWWSGGGNAWLGVAVAARRGSEPDEGVLRWLQLGGGRR